mmetsp:Transcript_9719/g.36134  ORF Transcript_9719/g.36134 Transcript_9719/m.36134 type:complete len:283 (+) Transcript_9719:271-1119(+)
MFSYWSSSTTTTTASSVSGSGATESSSTSHCEEQIIVQSNEKQSLEQQELPLISNDNFKQLNDEIDNESDYELQYDQDDIRMFMKVRGEGSDHESGIARYKYFGNIDFDIDLVFATLRDDEHRSVWDTRDMGREIIKVFEPQEDDEPHNSVCWSTKMGQYMVSSRDFVSLQACKHHTDQETGETISFEMFTRFVDGFKEPHPDFVRAKIIYLGLKLWRDENDPKKTHYVCITQVDPAGWITSSLVNWAVKYVPLEFEKNVEKGCAHRLENNLSNDEWKKLTF